MHKGLRLFLNTIGVLILFVASLIIVGNNVNNSITEYAKGDYAKFTYQCKIDYKKFNIGPMDKINSFCKERYIKEHPFFAQQLELTKKE